MRAAHGARLLIGSAAASVAVAAALGTGPAEARPISKPRWLGRVLVTEYFPVPEAWFVGRRVRARGIPGRHRVDWLYSARGVSMEGDGRGLDGRRYHIDALGSQGWVNRGGRRTRPRRNGRGWTRGRPFWRDVGWRTRSRSVTFPLEAGGWWAGRPATNRPPAGISFARGPSKPLRYWRSLAVDPRLIPLGSRIYVPAYRDTPGGGWFRAADVGGAIIGRHVDVYRPPPLFPSGGQALRRQRIRVIPPRRR